MLMEVSLPVIKMIWLHFKKCVVLQGFAYLIFVIFFLVDKVPVESHMFYFIIEKMLAHNTVQVSLYLIIMFIYCSHCFSSYAN